MNVLKGLTRTHAHTHTHTTDEVIRFPFRRSKKVKLRTWRVRNNSEKDENKAVRNEVMKNESDENWE
jgi:hypothetical protein